MAAPYLDDLRALLGPVTDALPSAVEVAFKHFFGGAALYVDGRICIILTPVGLALKLPEDARAELMARGGTPLRYFPKAPVKKHYAVVPAALRENESEFRPWAHRSIDYVLALPAS
jgi:TfoX/Sxy family transcriptional regulator of competence genes